ncbi:MAG: HAD family hydrolase [Oscillospiraceae bacterium]|nr:HAD family hydrolase [Oscillospiraceae bacterium]
MNITNRILNFKGEYRGLDGQTAQENLALYGYNTEEKQSSFRLHAEQPEKIKFFGVFRKLRLYIMLAAVFVYFIAGGGSPLKGGLLLLLAFGICVLEIVFENFTAKKLWEITSTSGVVMRVVRDGEIILVKREEIVQDDLIILQGGEIVPADAHILEGNDITAEESIFTGSFSPVKKQPGADSNRELKKSCVYKGTKILSGLLIARVFAIGLDVKICGGNSKLSGNRPKSIRHTEFESVVNNASTLLTYLAAALLVGVTVVRIIAAGKAEPQDGITVLQYLSGIVLPAVSFALCTIPVSLGLIIRLCYVDGAAKLSDKYGELRRLRTVELLNSVTAICIDKDAIVEAEQTPLTAEDGANPVMLSRVSVLSCDTRRKSPTNSYEKAILIGAAFKHVDIKELHSNTLLRNYPPENGDYNNIHGNLWDINGTRLLCVKGAPEKILSFCKHGTGELFSIQRKHSAYSKEGHYVMAVAFAALNRVDEDGELAPLPKSLLDVEYNYLGLLAFTSEINAGVAAAVQSCRNSGIRVVMLTPDNKETALSIARKVGLVNSAVMTERKIITGEEVIKVPGLLESSVSVISGVTPEQKTHIIDTLKSSGEITAVFGKESSDIPALESADVGIALSRNTTERKWDSGLENSLAESTTGGAAQISDLILDADSGSSDGFVKITEAMREARGFHRNIKRCTSVAISIFITIFLFGFVSLFAVGSSGGDYILEAVFVSTLAVISTVHTAFFFMNNDSDLSNTENILRPSDFMGKNQLNKGFLYGSVFQGMSLFAAVSIMFVLFRGGEGVTASDIRSIFLAVFISGIIAMSWVVLSYDKPFYQAFARDFKKREPKLPANFSAAILMTAGLSLFLLLAVYLPFLNAAFGLSSINPVIFITSVIVGTISQLWFDFIKRRFYK